MRGAGAARERAVGATRAGGTRVGGYDKGGAGLFGRGKVAGGGGRTMFGQSPLRVASEVGGGETSTGGRRRSRGGAECSKKEKSRRSGKLIQQFLIRLTEFIIEDGTFLPPMRAWRK